MEEVDTEDYEFCGLKIEHIKAIIDLMLDGRETNKKMIDITEEVLESSPHNPYKGSRININLPIKLKSSDTEFFKYGYEVHIYSNGMVNYTNGMGVLMGYNNPIDIYKIMIDNFKVVKDDIE